MEDYTIPMKSITINHAPGMTIPLVFLVGYDRDRTITQLYPAPDFVDGFMNDGKLSEEGIYYLKLLRSCLDTVFETNGIAYDANESLPRPESRPGRYERIIDPAELKGE